MLSQDTVLLIGRWFMQGHYALGIPGPLEGMSLLRHIEGMQKMVEEYWATNPGAENLRALQEIQHYIEALESIVGDLVVLQAIPLSAAARLVKEAESHEG